MARVEKGSYWMFGIAASRESGPLTTASGAGWLGEHFLTQDIRVATVNSFIYQMPPSQKVQGVGSRLIWKGAPRGTLQGSTWEGVEGLSCCAISTKGSGAASAASLVFPATLIAAARPVCPTPPHALTIPSLSCNAMPANHLKMCSECA